MYCYASCSITFLTVTFFHTYPKGVNGLFLLNESFMWVRLYFLLTTSEHCCSAAVLINGPESVTLTCDGRCSALSETEKSNPLFSTFIIILMKSNLKRDGRVVW